MTTDQHVLDPRIAEVATAVRARLRDLTPTERDELAADLETNLVDLVAERGIEALPEPATYAAELRAAGGFSARAGRSGGPGVGRRVEAMLDEAAARWDALVGGLPGRPWELVVALRPTWWVLRAWVALSVVDLTFGSGAYDLGLSIVPSLLGWGAPLLTLAVLGSLLIGVGRVWPGRGGVGARVTLLVLNLFAISFAPIALDSVATAADVVRWYGL